MLCNMICPPFGIYCKCKQYVQIVIVKQGPGALINVFIVTVHNTGGLSMFEGQGQT